jgi:hypothetical protein
MGMALAMAQATGHQVATAIIPDTAQVLGKITVVMAGMWPITKQQSYQSILAESTNPIRLADHHSVATRTTDK